MAVGIEKTTYERYTTEENSHNIQLTFPAEVSNDPNLSEVKKIFSGDGYVNRNAFSSFISDVPDESILKSRELWTRWAKDVARTDGELGRKMFQRQIQLLEADVGDTCEIRPSEHHIDFLADNKMNRPAHGDQDELANDCVDEQLNPSYQAQLQNDNNMAQIDAAMEQLCREHGDAVARRKVTCMVCVNNEVGSCLYPCKHIVACRECYTKITHCPACGGVVEERGIVRMRE